ncbi:MAG: hypothetical protein AAF434_06765 [Pseudomonadota bacterium]
MGNWEKLKILSIAVSSIIIPIVIAIVGHMFSKASAERELQGRFIELSVQILEQEPSEHTKNLRSWAVNVINQYSEVPIDEITKEELIESVPIFSNSPLSGRAKLNPGQSVSVEPAAINFDSCAAAGGTVRCKLKITPNSGITSVGLRGSYLSSSARSIEVRSHEQSWNYRHGPQITKLLSLNDGVANEFDMIFTPLNDQSVNLRATITFNFKNQRVTVDFQPSIDQSSG